MASEPVSWSNITGLPDWLEDLKPLVSVASTLVAVASNPKEWLRTHVFELIAEWVVRQILDAAQYVLGWVFFAADRTATIILGVAEPLASPFGIVGDAVVGGIEDVYSVPLSLAHSAGLAGPPAAAFAVALVSAMLAVAVFAVWRAFPVTEAIGGGLERLR